MKIRKLIFALIKLILDKTNQIQTHFRHVYLQRAIKGDGGEKKKKKNTYTQFQPTNTGSVTTYQEIIVFPYKKLISSKCFHSKQKA